MRYLARDKDGKELGYIHAEESTPSDELKAEAIRDLGPDVWSVEEAPEVDRSDRVGKDA